VNSVRRLLKARGSETGLTLVEVMIAMMIFAMIAVGVAFSLTSSLVTTRDARAREVAANLAAKDIDSVRAMSDVTLVVNQVRSTTIDGIRYTVTRTTGWISSTGADSSCGSPNGGVLLYKHVNERVTWSGARTASSMVRSDTLVAPSGRLTDPSMGSILISVLSSAGIGVAGIAVNAVPSATNPNGATTIGSAPALTDSQGCTYIFKARPGNYDVTISGPANTYISDSQIASPTKSGIPVSAGDSSTATFQFDVAARVNLTYASTDPAVHIVFPANLDVNFWGQSLYSPTVTVPSTNLVTTVLDPVSAGYSVFTGVFAAAGVSGSSSCLSSDPGAWAIPNAQGAIGHRSAPIATVPGGTASGFVPMGVFTANSASNVFLTAVSATAAASVGDPGCASSPSVVYNFASKTTSTSTLLALPFGTWKLFSGTTAGAQSTLIASSAITLSAGSPANTDAGVFTLDPRLVSQ
jgi:prepilin-type N-terminal cleavage/methylation domain-containing protein